MYAENAGRVQLPAVGGVSWGEVFVSRSALTAVIRQAADPGDPDPVLLERFRAAGDHAAFAELVRRYARLVWGQCRHLLANEADAEDAFQATFLALARHAGRVRDPNRLGPWLHTVAGRVCRTALRAATRRAKRERAAAVPDRSRPVADSAWEAAAAVVHDEVHRLPEPLRVAFVLCVLEGKTPTAAAAQLGVPVGTVGSHLHRAKRRLLKRLAARGVGAAVAFATMCDATPTASAVGRAADPSHASPAVLSLLPGAVPMTVSLAKLLLVVGLVALGAAGLLLPAPAQDGPKAEPPKADKPAVKTDSYGDPLPDKAVMRLGTVQFRVDDIDGAGFKKSGELVALTSRLEVFTYPADGGSKPTVSYLMGERSKYGYPRVALSADGRFAAAHTFTNGKKDGRLVVWDLSGPKPTEHLSRDQKFVNQIALSPDGNWLIAQNEDRSDPERLLLADLKAKKWKALPVAEVGFVERYSFTADGSRVAVVAGSTLMVFDTANAELLLNARFPNDRIEVAALSPDGKTVAMLPSGREPAVRLLNVADGAEVKGADLPKVKARAVGFGPDGKTLWVLGGGQLREWDLAAGKWVRETAVPLDNMHVPAPVWSADGKRFAAFNQYTLSVHDAGTWKPHNADALAAGPVTNMFGVTVSPDGKTIATDGDTVHLWDAASGKFLGNLKAAWGNGPMLVFLPDSKTFLAVIGWEVIVECEARTGKELRRFTLPEDLKNKVALRDLRLSADGKELFTMGSSTSSEWKSVRLRWDVAKGEVSGRGEADERDRFEEDLLGLKSPDGEWTFSGGSVRRVDGSEKPTEVFPSAERAVGGQGAWSADSKLVALPRATGKTPEERRKDENGTQVVFDVSAKKQVAELPTGKVVRAAFSPDGKRLATLGHAGLVVWDVATGKEVFRAECDSGTLIVRRGIAFTPDGKRLITAHGTHALVWEVGGR